MCITPSNADPPRIYSPELLQNVNSDQSFPIPRDISKELFRLRIWSPRYKYENRVKTENPKPNTPENVYVKEKTIKTTLVTDVRLGVMNVLSLGNKLVCVINHITDNRLDIVGITETWLSNDNKNNMSVVNTCLNNGYNLHHCPINTGSCCCCSPSETYGRKWGDSNFQILTELPVPLQAAGVVGTFYCA